MLRSSRETVIDLSVIIYLFMLIRRQCLLHYVRTEDNFSNREVLKIQNTSKLAVHATFWLLSTVHSDTFILDPESMLLEPGQKQVTCVLVSTVHLPTEWLAACLFHYSAICFSMLI